MNSNAGKMFLNRKSGLLKGLNSKMVGAVHIVCLSNLIITKKDSAPPTCPQQK